MSKKDNKPKEHVWGSNPLGPSGATEGDRIVLKAAKKREKQLRKTAIRVERTKIMNGHTVKYVQEEE